MEKDEEFWLLVVQLEVFLIAILLAVLACGFCSVQFRRFVIWFVEVQSGEVVNLDCSSP